MKNSLPAPGFQRLGLPARMLRALQRLGYNQPTPIQRKVIPLLLSGENDVLASARTGSGKTLAFILPLVLRLGEHSARVGARAVVLAPTRELTSQIFLFLTSLLKKSGSSLRAASITAADAIPTQFSLLLSNPDILVATPGRLLHLLQEANMGLQLDILVVDEADRLLEDPVLAAQLHALLPRLARTDATVTCLTSATLPSLGSLEPVFLLRPDPRVVFLDVEQRLSQDLRCEFIAATSEMREAMLIASIERRFSALKGVVFVATRHSAEWLSALLRTRGIDNAALYGKMDAEARKLAMRRFIKDISVLVVTDVAARGIDLPFLDYVFNFDMAPTPKLFIHRAGRVARAGRPGTAVSFVLQDERPFFSDLKLALNLDVPLYKVDPTRLDLWVEWVSRVTLQDTALQMLRQCHERALRRFSETRTSPAPSAFRAAKSLSTTTADIDLEPVSSSSLVEDLKRWRPSAPAFRLGISGPHRSTISGPSVLRPPASVLPAAPNRSLGLVDDELGHRQRSIREPELADGRTVGERYSEWRKTIGRALPAIGSIETRVVAETSQKIDYRNRRSRTSKGPSSLGAEKIKSARTAGSELKRPEQVLRQRAVKARKQIKRESRHKQPE